MTGFNPLEQQAYDALRARGIESPSWEQIYEIVHHELGGPSLASVRGAPAVQPSWQKWSETEPLVLTSREFAAAKALTRAPARDDASAHQRRKAERKRQRQARRKQR